MILIGLGSNLASANGHSPAQNLENALASLEARGIEILQTSQFHETAPLPADEAPWYVNAVAKVSAELSAQELLRTLLHIETHLGRVRSTRNAPRVIDLDLLDFQGRVITESNLILPHPRMAERAFVLKPLNEIVPSWHHPVSGKSVMTLLQEIENNQIVQPLTS